MWKPWHVTTRRTHGEFESAHDQGAPNPFKKWRALRDSNSRPSGFRLRRALSSLVIPRRCPQDSTQLFSPLTGFQVLLVPQRCGTRRLLFFVHQAPRTTISGCFADARVMLPNALRHVSARSRVMPTRHRAEQDVNEEHTMARPERFELPTFWFVARRSIQLS